MGCPSPSKLPLPIGNVNPHLILDSLGPSEPITQTASRSVPPFLHSSLQSVPILYNGLPLFPSKLPLPMGALDPHLIRGSFSNPSPQAKCHLDRLNHFCRAYYCDRPTDHATQSVTIDHIYVYSTVMWSNSIFYEYEIRLEIYSVTSYSLHWQLARDSVKN